MPSITRVTIEGLNNTIDIDIEGVKCFMPWETFVKETNCPFDTENVFFVAYEPDRNIITVEKRGGIFENGKEVPEIIWIESNFEAIKNFAEKYKPIEPKVKALDLIIQYFYVTDWMVSRHKEQLELGIQTTLDANQYSKLLQYRQYLRDYPSDSEDIDSIIKPEFYETIT
jgi:hypothetical protein